MPPNQRFLRACRQQPVDVTPVWLMRQAGRYMAEYRALRERYSILEMIKEPEIAAAVTLQPLRRFNLDAAIIFADILTLPEAMGLRLEFIRGEGPVFHNPIRSATDVRALRMIAPDEALGFTMAAIRLVARELDGRLPLIGFSGAPFTLACYAIEGGASRHFLKTKAFMLEQPEAWASLMYTLSTAVGAYLVAQVRAGAAALQLFDSWVGALAPTTFDQLIRPYLEETLAKIRAETDVPVIYFGTDTATLLPMISSIGFDVVGTDWRIGLDTARHILGPAVSIQGNLDPAVLFTRVSNIKREVARILAEAAGAPGHIFNLGHGILPETPEDHVAALVDLVHQHAAGAA